MTREGHPLRVAVLGGSLTWGANASAPQITSYRGRMGTWLRERYPDTPVHLIDASIGGTGSMLGLFRLDRDVLAHKPDMVFLDFTYNDGIMHGDDFTSAAYESILRELLAHGIPVMTVIMGDRRIAESDSTPPTHARCTCHSMSRICTGPQAVRESNKPNENPHLAQSLENLATHVLGQHPQRQRHYSASFLSVSREMSSTADHAVIGKGLTDTGR